MQPCNMCLASRRDDELRQLATPERYYNEFNENLIFDFFKSVVINHFYVMRSFNSYSLIKSLWEI